MATKGNRFKKEPAVDMNDPAALLTAGKTRETTPVPAQEKPKKEERPATPAEVEASQEVAEDAPSGFDLTAFEEKQKQAKKPARKAVTSFTLTPEVHAELVRRSKKAGISVSSYLDGILMAVFGMDE